MKTYEGIFVFSSAVSEEVRKQQVSGLEALFAKFKAAITQKNEWGKRALAYPVKKMRDGIFLLIDFEIPPNQLKEFRKALEINQDVIKFMITIKDPRLASQPKAPSTDRAAEHAARV